jgi:hypothetical protein
LPAPSPSSSPTLSSTLADWFLHSVRIVSIAAHHFPIDTVSRQKLEKFYSQHKQLGSIWAFYRHRSVFRFFDCLITLAQSLKVNDAEFFITELLKHLEARQLQVACRIAFCCFE